MEYTEKGTVKWFNEEKGYGFITPETGGKDVFVHTRGCKENAPLQEGQKVGFDVKKDGEKGPQAINVRVI